MTASPENLYDIRQQAPDPRVVQACRVLIGGEGLPANPAAAVGMLFAAVEQGSGAAAEDRKSVV